MVILIGAYLISMIPAAAMYFWLKNGMKKPADEDYKKTCRSALMNGFLSTVAVLPVSLAFTILLNFLGLKDHSSFLAAALHDFFVLAFAEELVKSLMLRKTLKNTEYNYSWLDMIVFMVVVSLGFEVLESLIYVVGANVGQILIRGILLMHGGFGFIEGWFYGKAAYTGKKSYAVIGFLIAWILHGAYDFGLSDEFAALGEWSAIVSVSIAALSLVIFIVMIIFFAKKNKKQEYLEPLAENE